MSNPLTTVDLLTILPLLPGFDQYTGRGAKDNIDTLVTWTNR